MIQRSRRGQGETAKEHQANLQKTKDEVQQFLDANNLARPHSPAEWRQCYRELGKFLAMRAFLTNTPQVVMEFPVAPITDDREHMIMRAICDERISLPLDAFKGGRPNGWPQNWALQATNEVQYCRDFHLKHTCPGNCGRSHACPVRVNGWTCNGDHSPDKCPNKGKA